VSGCGNILLLLVLERQEEKDIERLEKYYQVL